MKLINVLHRSCHVRKAILACVMFRRNIALGIAVVLAATATVATAADTSAEDRKPAEERVPGESWEIVIVPNQTAPKSYAAKYQSIPFSRAEFEANPSYRHEAAMELLFGKLRPMVIHKNQGRPAQPVRRRGFQRLKRYHRYPGRYGNYYVSPLQLFPLLYPGY